VPTTLLYHEDPLLLRFRARVEEHARFGDRASLVLDRTAFYPESGGQMADRGRLAGAALGDVQVDEEGRVHHVLDGEAEPPPIGAEVEGVIDRERRRLHMALHTGQHLLSRALLDEAGGETMSSRLGESACTIDLGLGAVDERALARAEALVNAVIDDDVPIRAFFPTEEELRALPLRRAPKVAEHVRVVAIGDFDVSPCGGTHCTHAAQVGLVRVTGVERYKGMTRITFAAGRRARAALVDRDDVLRGLGRDFHCGPRDVPSAVAKLRRELQEARQALGAARARLAGAAAEELLATARASEERRGERRGEGRVVARFDDGDSAWLRAVAARVTSEHGVVALLAAPAGEGGDAQLHVLAARGDGSGFDCGAFLRRLTARTGGKGGGRADSAEGRIPASIDFAQVVAEILDEIGK
jgi:alanyl-tRNA synthetase